MFVKILTMMIKGGLYDLDRRFFSWRLHGWLYCLLVPLVCCYSLSSAYTCRWNGGSEFIVMFDLTYTDNCTGSPVYDEYALWSLGRTDLQLRTEACTRCSSSLPTSGPTYIGPTYTCDANHHTAQKWYFVYCNGPRSSINNSSSNLPSSSSAVSSSVVVPSSSSAVSSSAVSSSVIVPSSSSSPPCEHTTDEICKDFTRNAMTCVGNDCNLTATPWHRVTTVTTCPNDTIIHEFPGYCEDRLSSGGSSSSSVTDNSSSSTCYRSCWNSMNYAGLPVHSFHNTCFPEDIPSFYPGFCEDVGETSENGVGGDGQPGGPGPSPGGGGGGGGGSAGGGFSYPGPGMSYNPGAYSSSAAVPCYCVDEFLDGIPSCHYSQGCPGGSTVMMGCHCPDSPPPPSSGMDYSSYMAMSSLAGWGNSAFTMSDGVDAATKANIARMADSLGTIARLLRTGNSLLDRISSLIETFVTFFTSGDFSTANPYTDVDDQDSIFVPRDTMYAPTHADSNVVVNAIGLPSQVNSCACPTFTLSFSEYDFFAGMDDVVIDFSDIKGFNLCAISYAVNIIFATVVSAVLMVIFFAF